VVFYSAEIWPLPAGARVLFGGEGEDGGKRKRVLLRTGRVGGTGVEGKGFVVRSIKKEIA
jgi:hypothetical protein